MQSSMLAFSTLHAAFLLVLLLHSERCLANSGIKSRSPFETDRIEDNLDPAVRRLRQFQVSCEEGVLAFHVNVFAASSRIGISTTTSGTDRAVRLRRPCHVYRHEPLPRCQGVRSGLRASLAFE